MPSDKAMQIANQYGCTSPELLANQIDEALAEHMRVIEMAERALASCVNVLPREKGLMYHDWQVEACQEAKTALAAINKLKGKK